MSPYRPSLNTDQSWLVMWSFQDSEFSPGLSFLTHRQLYVTVILYRNLHLAMEAVP